MLFCQLNKLKYIYFSTCHREEQGIAAGVETEVKNLDAKVREIQVRVDEAESEAIR